MTMFARLCFSVLFLVVIVVIDYTVFKRVKAKPWVRALAHSVEGAGSIALAMFWAVGMRTTLALGLSLGMGLYIFFVMLILFRRGRVR